MFIIKHFLKVSIVLIIIFFSQSYAQPVNLVLENMTISTSEYYEATNSIIVGPDFTITNTGNVTLDAPAVSYGNMVYVIQGGELLVLSETTAVNVNSEEQGLPNTFILDQNFPNPFNPSTTIAYHIPEQSVVTIKVYDALGNELETLVNENKPSGRYEVDFNASALSSGIYFYQLKAGSFFETKKMILMK